MLYPLILVIVACVLFTLVVKIVAPGFAFLNNSAFRPFEWLTQSQYTVPVLAVILPILVILAACIWRWRSGRLRSASFPGMGWLSFLTGARTVFRWGEAARFAELLRLLVDRGLPLEKSLQLAGEATGDRRLRTAALQFAERVQSGDMRPEPGRSNRNFESAFPVLIRLALLHSRDRSLLSAGLRQASTMYRERTIRAADWYAEYLPVLLTVVIGGTFTVGFTLFVLWPYIAMLYELAGPGWG
jgi:type II secretory pathway component PulF